MTDPLGVSYVWMGGCGRAGGWVGRLAVGQESNICGTAAWTNRAIDGTKDDLIDGGTIGLMGKGDRRTDGWMDGRT